jgi:2-polyprenyl-3-methyl-5-hydroxy-6-metoxy-1,4-benzoquinol methylase
MDYNNKPDGYYKNIRHEMLAFLPANAKRVLDVGCGEGAFANAIKNKNKAEVWGIELMPDAAKEAQKVLDKVFCGPCEGFLETLPNDYFDAIYFNDVLEHLVNPYSVLKIIKEKLSENGVVISSIPNLRYYRIFKEIYFKESFEYKEDGVLDKTHLRFFTKKSIQKMYEDLGYEVMSHVGINGEKSMKPYIYNIPRFFKGMDMKHLQFATVARKS